MDHAPKLRDKGTKVTNLEGAAAAVAIVEASISSIGSSESFTISNISSSDSIFSLDRSTLC